MLEHIRSPERARFAAMMSGDLTALSALLDDDLIYIHSNGRAAVCERQLRRDHHRCHRLRRRSLL
jgi:hypothetical protein